MRTIPFLSATALALLAGFPAALAQPVPSGKIAYVQNGDLYLRYLNNHDPNSDGTTIQLTATTDGETHPRLSPDGTRLVYTGGRARSFGTYIIDVTATNPPATAVRVSTRAHWPKWSADGTRLAVGSGQTPSPGIYVINVQAYPSPSLNDYLIVFLREGSYPAWSPLGWSANGTPAEQIAFVSAQFAGSTDSDVCLMDSDGANAELAFVFPGTDYGLDWQPSGLIAFAHAPTGQLAKIYLYDPAHPLGDSNPDRLTDPLSSNNSTHHEQQPAFSPDGQFVAVAISRVVKKKTTTHLGIFLERLSDGALVDANGNPSGSPVITDGQQPTWAVF